jgi:hypothetical protein
MATHHGVHKDGVVFILSLELLISGDSVNPHREHEAFVVTQPLRARLLFWRVIAIVLVAGLREEQIRQKAEIVVCNFGSQGFQSFHFGLWSKAHFAQATMCCLRQESSSIVNFEKS